MKKIFVILKKELKRYFTDKRMLVGLLLPGLLIYLVYNFMGDYVNESSGSINNFNVVMVNCPSELEVLNTVEGWEININKVDEITDVIKEQVERSEIDLVVIYEKNFYENMINYNSNLGGTAPNIEMYYNSTSQESMTIFQYYQSALSSLEGQLANKFDINRDGGYDLATEEAVASMVLTSLLPFLLVMLLFSGCMTVCAEAIAGEKERGTIATLLVTPTKRSHLALGKVLALSITSLVSASASFIGLIASIPKLVGSDVDISMAAYNIGTYVLLFVVILSTVLLFTVLLSIISTFAKNVKEASMYSIPGMLVVVVVGVTSMMSTTAVTDAVLYLIPVYNSVQCIIGILSFSLSTQCLVVTIVSNLVYVGLGVYILTKLFNSEKVMFQK